VMVETLLCSHRLASLYRGKPLPDCLKGGCVSDQEAWNAAKPLPKASINLSLPILTNQKTDYHVSDKIGCHKVIQAAQRNKNRKTESNKLFDASFSDA